MRLTSELVRLDIYLLALGHLLNRETWSFIDKVSACTAHTISLPQHAS